MPLYFVDLNDGRTETRYKVGSDASSPEAACDDTMQMLVDPARSRVAHSSEQLLVATVRDGADQELYRILLALTCCRIG